MLDVEICDRVGERCCVEGSGLTSVFVWILSGMLCTDNMFSFALGGATNAVVAPVVMGSVALAGDYVRSFHVWVGSSGVTWR